MHDPFDLVIWALAIAISWMILTNLTGCEDWIKSLVGRKNAHRALEDKINSLEARIKELEKNR